MQYSIEPRTRGYVQGYGFLSFAKKYKEELLVKGLHSSKKVVHKEGEFVGNKIADTIAKSNNVKIEKQEPVEEIFCQKKRINIKQIEKSIMKMEHYKISKL